MKISIKMTLVSVLLLSILFGASVSFAQNEDALKKLDPLDPLKSLELIESEKYPEVQRSHPILLPQEGEELPDSSVQLRSAPSDVSIQMTAESASDNTISNSSVETESSVPGLPLGWNKGGYGTNTRVFTYPVQGFNSSRAVKVEVTSYTSGDAKWFFNDVFVTPGKTYTFSDNYISDIPSILTIRYKLSNGTFTYVDLATAGPSSSYKKISAEFVPPANAVSATVFHLIKQKGFLITDDFSLNESGTTSPPPPSSGLVPNSNFEQVGTNGLPLKWTRGGWGTNTRTFTYPVTGSDGSKAARVNISSYSSGDAKWAFDPINVSPGLYSYSNEYSSNVRSVVTVQFKNSNGAYTYQDIAVFSPSEAFKKASVDFQVPPGTQNITVFHLIQGVGFLTIDNVVIQKKSGTAGVFTTGAVTFRFDDGWLSQYQNAVPKLNSAGFKGTFYIISQRIRENGFIGYMNKSEIADIYSKGHEIGAHTRTHRFLTSLSAAEQQKEIQGSRQDLLSWNVGPINSFSYPFGDYNSTSIGIVKNAGFTSGAATINGNVSPTSDPYQLERRGVTNATTVAQIKGWIDEAAANKRWLIISFHEVNTSGNLYAITPTAFNQVVDYVTQKKIPVVTVEEGLRSL